MPLTVIRASAGSGKTYRLAVSYLKLLLEAELENAPLDPACILATTFTRAAAGEILDRVLHLLSRAVLSAPECRALAEGTGLPLERELCGRLLARLAAHLDRLTVSTMDSFFGQIAKAFAAELGLAPGWRMAVDEAEAEVQRATLRTLLEQADHERLFQALCTFRRHQVGSSMQEALNRLSGVFASVPPPRGESAFSVPPPRTWSGAEVQAALNVIAAAATWMPKTKKGDPDKRWDKAVREVEALLAPGMPVAPIFGAGLVKGALGDGTYYKLPIPPEFHAVVAPLVAIAREEIQTQHRARMEALAWMARYYRKARLETIFGEASYTFGDVPRLVLGRALRSDDLYYRLGAKFQHVLFDEFQDTSREQYAFFQPLLEEIGSNGASSIVVVGDEKQAIYGWRGGDRELMHGPLRELGKRIGSLEAPPLTLSYRSSPAVLRAVNQVFGALRGGWFPKDPVIEAAGRAWAEGFADHAPAPRVEKLQGSVRLLEVAGEKEEIEGNLVATAVDLVRWHLAQDAGRKIAILLRKTRLMPRIIAEIQKACPDLDVSGEGGNPLTDSRAVELILSVFTWLDHPGHTAARFHVLSSPVCGVFGFPESAEPGEKPGPEERWAAARLRRVLLEEGYAGVIHRWVRSEAFIAHGSEYDRQRCGQLLEVAREYDQRGPALRPGRFVAHVRSRRVERRGGSAVRVMSIHASKGLEFEAVILMELDARQQNGGEPSIAEHGGELHVIPRKEDAPLLGLDELVEARKRHDFSEELCVLYVGMTRARSFLDIVLRESASAPAAALLRAGLKPEAGGVAVHAEGLRARECDAANGRAPALPRADLGIARAPYRFEAAVLPSAPSRAAYATPSSREDGGLVSVASLFAPSNREAMKRGELIHAWLSAVEWADGGLPSVEALLGATRALWSGFQRESVATWARHLLSQIETPGTSLGRVMRRPGPEPLDVWRERRFAVMMEGEDGPELLSGSFDRVVIRRDAQGAPLAAGIIDFKTDRFTGEEERRAVEERYRPQLASYARALALLLPGLPPAQITTSLCLLGEEKRSAAPGKTE